MSVMLVSNSVLVRGSVAGELVELVAAEVNRRSVRGVVISDEVREVLGDLSRAAVAHDQVTRSDPGNAQRSDPGNGEMIAPMTTREVAELLGIVPRAVVARLHRGTLAGELVDGRWLIDLRGAA